MPSQLCYGAPRDQQADAIRKLLAHRPKTTEMCLRPGHAKLGLGASGAHTHIGRSSNLAAMRLALASAAAPLAGPVSPSAAQSGHTTCSGRHTGALSSGGNAGANGNVSCGVGTVDGVT